MGHTLGRNRTDVYTVAIIQTRFPGAKAPIRENPMGFGLKEMLLIGIALLILFGPAKLPELGAAFGKSIREFKKASKELTDSETEAPSTEKK
jgi:sec-independent protein translocase protein TatA